MRYIKFYEDFTHDEVYDVMMSICEEVSFGDSKRYPSSARVRVYSTKEERVIFDPKPYEEYLSGWTIRTGVGVNYEDSLYSGIPEHMIVFLKGDLDGAVQSWLAEVYGGLRQVVKGGAVYYVDGKGLPLFMYDENHGGYYFVSYYRIWSFLENFLGMDFERGSSHISKWLSDSYGLSGLVPRIVLMPNEVFARKGKTAYPTPSILDGWDAPI